MLKIYKKLVDIALVGILTLIAFNANAQQGSVPISYDPIAGSTVENLYRIGIKFNSSDYPGGIDYSSASPEIYKDGELSSIIASYNYDSSDWWLGYVQFRELITEPGTYTIKVGAGHFYAYDDNSVKCPDFEVTYIIEESEQGEGGESGDSSHNFESIIPAENTVDSPITDRSLLPINITISTAVTQDAEFINKIVNIYKDDDFSSVYTKAIMGADYSNWAMINIEKVSDGQDCSETGKYTVVIPANSYTWLGELNKEIHLTFYVDNGTEGEDPGITNTDFYKIDPMPNTVEGPIIEQLLPIYIQIDNTISADPDIVDSSAIKIYKDDDFSKPYATPYTKNHDSDWACLYLIATDGIYCNEPGKYTVVFPAGAYTWQGEPNEEFELVYYVGDMSQGGGEEPEPDPSVKLECTPDPSIPLASLETVSVSFVDYSGQILVYNDGAVYDKDGNKVATTTAAGGAQPLVLNVSPVITTPGEYTIRYNEGDLVVYAGGMTNIPAFEITYVVEAPKVVTYDFEPKPYTIDPSNTLNIAKLSKFTFEVDGVASYINQEKNLIYVYDADNNVVTTGTMLPDSRSWIVGIEATFEEEITEEGTYTIVIPQGSFGDSVWAEANAESGRANPELRYEYVIGNIYDFTYQSIFPANNAEVVNLEFIEIETDLELADVKDNVINVYDANDQVVATGKFRTRTDDTSFIVCEFDKKFAVGSYNVVIPKGTFGDARWYSQNCGRANAELILTYNVTIATGVEYINSDDALFTVYSIDGVCLLRNAKYEDLKKLQKGFYIVNGKKIALY